MSVYDLTTIKAKLMSSLGGSFLSIDLDCSLKEPRSRNFFLFIIGFDIVGIRPILRIGVM